MAELQMGVVSRRQLRALGVSRDHERSQVEAQRWSRPTSRVVALLTGSLDREQWMWVAQLHAGQTAQLFAETSLEAHGMRGWEPEQALVLVTHGVKVPAATGLSVHHSRRAGSILPVVRRGLRCEPAARAVISAAARMPGERRALGLVLASVQQRITTPHDIAAQLGAGIRHAAAIHRVLGHAEAGADSLREVDLGHLVLRAGFTSFRRQVRVDTVDGSRPYDVGADLADGTLLLLESDGVHHLDPRVREADATKDAAAAALGHRVVRIPVQLLGQHEERIVQQLSRIRIQAEKRVRPW